MHLGLFMECDYRLDATEEQALDEVFRMVRTAEDGGLDGIWLAERHFASPTRMRNAGTGATPSIASAPLILATAIACRTSRIRVGMAVSVLPLAHPIRLAEEAATLDQISGGRLDFGVGRSGFAAAYAGYGIPYDESRGRFKECLDILVQAWTQDTCSYSGNYYSFSNVSVSPKPRQKPHPPLRIAATTAETFPHVGEQGYPIFIGLRGQDLETNAANLAKYREAWHAAGHAGDGDVYVRIPMYVAPTAEQAYEEPRETTVANYRRRGEGYASRTEGAGTDEERAEFARRLFAADYDDLLRTRLAYGTPDAVAKRLTSLRDELGLSGFLLEPNAGGGVPSELVHKSVKLFAEEVAPALH